MYKYIKMDEDVKSISPLSIRQLAQQTLFLSAVLNLTELIALRENLRSVRKVIYFYENQLVYPRQSEKEQDFQYGYNQILSRIVADVVLFNSKYNADSFLDNIQSFLKKQLNFRVKNLRDKIAPKCKVVYFPIDLNKLELITTFSLIAKEELADRIVHFGYINSKKEYYEFLKSCDIVESTSKHEFFGVAMLEATYLGCLSLCPRALVYPELYPDWCLFTPTVSDLVNELREYCELKKIAEMKNNIQIHWDRYDANTILQELRRILLPSCCEEEEEDSQNSYIKKSET